MVRSLRPRATEGNAFERKGTSMPQVAYTRDNVEKCRCESCPVQVRSTCARDLYEVSEGSETLPLPAHLPGLYCSTGKTMCTDVTFVNLCDCPGCLIWSEYKLSANHYCKLGSAAEIGR